MDLREVSARLEANAVEQSSVGWRLNANLRLSVIAREGNRALVIGFGACGVGLAWLRDEDARHVYGYAEALRVG